MGYRLSINHNNNEIYYGTKYYGYDAGVELVDIIKHGSKSCKYLLDKGYVNDKMFWCDPMDNEIKLNKKELLKFIRLYIEDLRKENTIESGFTFMEDVFEELEKVYNEIKEKYSKEDNYTIEWY